MGCLCRTNKQGAQDRCLFSECDVVDFFGLQTAQVFLGHPVPLVRGVSNLL